MECGHTLSQRIVHKLSGRILNMKSIIFSLLLIFSTSAFPDNYKGKIEVCRHPSIIAQADKSKVELQTPILFKQYKQSYNGDTDFWIEIEHDITLGRKPSCLITEGVVTRNINNMPPPKKGSTWQADATATPGQYWGKKPIERQIKIGNTYGTVIESDAGAGGEIQDVSLRGRVLEDFK